MKLKSPGIESTADSGNFLILLTEHIGIPDSLPENNQFFKFVSSIPECH